MCYDFGPLVGGRFGVVSPIGPADYKPEKALNLEHKPYYSFGDRKSLDKPRETPGPADYTPEKALNLEHKPYFSFGDRKPLHKSRDTPGPDSYNPEKAQHLEHKPYFSFGNRKPCLYKPSDTPAPGTYCPEKINMSKSPQYSFGVKTEMYERNTVPGPGEYSPEKAMLLLEKALQFTFGLRPPASRPNNIPAPNIYNIPSALGGTKEGNKKAAPAYSISSRQKIFTDDRVLVPGPGAYETIKPDTTRAKSPAYSISARFPIPDDHSQIPGPGAHCPEKVFLDIPPAHTFGIRHSPYICNLKDAVY
ncbi:uncharacterized protein [Temnothorax longispinosus]|uniref:uncharacterized protein n=1 Tax=Temnothorax longispinosus TaxID=300112 RepID=UPI003A99FA07